MGIFTLLTFERCFLIFCFYVYCDSHHMPVRLKASLKVQRTRLQYAAWLGNTTSLVIVVDNDIYLKQSPSDEEDIRITDTGKHDLIYNGVPDWLYQGKFVVYGSIEAINSNSRKLIEALNDIYLKAQM